MTIYEPENMKPEIIDVDDDADKVSCDGGGGALGHPVVWYSFDGGDVAECLYCDRLFVKRRATAQGRKDSGKIAGRTAGAAKEAAAKSKKTAAKKPNGKSGKKSRKRA